MKSEFDRWDSKVVKTEDCWLWKGATYRKGYGHFRRNVNGKWIMYKAHRFSFEFFKNNKVALDSSILICHSCDNPACVNPDHLFAGSAQDNVNDKLKKGRHRYGVKKGHRVLYPEDIKKIKNDYATGLYSMKTVGIMNNTSASQVHRVVTGKIHRKVGTEN